MFGKNLRHYRLKNGMNKSDLAKLCGLSAPTISNYENGTRRPESMDIIQRLADALHVSVLDFLSVWDEKLDVQCAEFRKQSKCNKGDQAYVQSAVEEYLNRFHEVVKVLGEKVLPQPPACRALRLLDDAEENAKQLRIHLGFSEFGPMGKLVECLENKGILVFFIEFPKGPTFSGMNGTVNGRPFIVLNQDMKPGVMRSTIAHELAHMMFNWSAFDGDEEKFATAIGGAFLFPADDLRRELGYKRNAITKDMLMTCSEYGVSLMLLAKRARICDIISSQSEKAFYIRAQQNGWRKNDPAEVAEEKATLFEQLVFRAVSQEEITIQKGAELLNQTVEYVENRCDFAC